MPEGSDLNDYVDIIKQDGTSTEEDIELEITAVSRSAKLGMLPLQLIPMHTCMQNHTLSLSLSLCLLCSSFTLLCPFFLYHPILYDGVVIQTLYIHVFV